jgi:deferrochelatase/peroxidase EfeB
MIQHPLPHEARADIQRLVVLNPRRRRVRHFVLSLAPKRAGLDLIRELLPDPKRPKPYAVTFAREGHERTPVDVSIGFTRAGLERMGVPPPYLGVFRRLTPAFADGAPRRAAGLGDAGPSAAEYWEKPGFELGKAHALVTLHADKEDELNAAATPLRQRFDDYGLRVLQVLDGRHLEAPPGTPADQEEPQHQTWVHFGYRDGVSRVSIRGLDEEHDAEEREPGEFLLGYPNDSGYNPWLLPLADERVRRFFVNGSFGVFRKMKQDVRGFEEQVDRWAEELADPAGEFTFKKQRELWRTLVKAKLCGRRPDGGQPGVLDLSRSGEERARQMAGPPLSAFSAFDRVEHKEDPEGTICPYGAHTRRMNPRGGSRLAHSRIRPIIRRGVAYGPPYDRSKPDEHERGLLGMFFCASIEAQFEHLLAHWAERVPLGSPDPGTAKDPLIGQHDDAEAPFVVPVAGGGRQALAGWRSFVTTRGMLYAFYPGRQALRQIADRDYEPSREGARPSWEGIPE